MRTLLAALLLLTTVTVRAQNVIWAVATGDWRNGPVVVISPLFETTEMARDAELIAYVKAQYPEFATINDITLQRFGTIEEGLEARKILATKYGARKLEVDLMEQPPLTGETPAVAPK
jgi:hypothetical protein